LRRQPSLRSQLNQIRLWVRQGRTDAWIAHKLDVSIDQLARFKRDHDLMGDEAAPARPADPLSVPPPAIDLSEAAEEAEEDEIETEIAALSETQEDDGRGAARESSDAEADERGDDREPGAPARRRRRGRRGGRRRKRPSSYEATFDHGEDGYGLWLDPAVVDNPIYSEHWAGHREVVVTLDRDSITIRRANGEESDEDAGEPADEGQ
jgi:hypothetical protein